MRYILLKRNTGELVLEALQNLSLELHTYDTKAYKEFPGQPKEPPRPVAPEIGKYATYRQRDDGSYGWVAKSPEDVTAYEAAKAAYDAKFEVWRPKWDAYLKRRDAWQARRERAALAELKRLDGAEVRYSFAGGSSRGRNLAPRVRLLTAADQRKFDDLDKQIVRLHERRGALIEAAFLRGRKPTPEQLLKVGQQVKSEQAKRRPVGYQTVGDRVIRKVRGAVEPSIYEWKNTLSGYWSRTPKPKPAATPVPEARKAA